MIHDAICFTPYTHYDDVRMGAIASQITSLTIVYSIVYSDADQRKHQSSASLAFVRGIHRWPVNFPHKWPVTRKMFPLDDVIMHTPTWGKCPDIQGMLWVFRSGWRWGSGSLGHRGRLEIKELNYINRAAQNSRLWHRQVITLHRFSWV